MKTALEWFNELPEPYRTQAIENTKEAMIDLKDKKISGALRGAFIWELSPQGHDYWQELYETLLSENK